MIKRCSCLTEWDASGVARWSFLPPASLGVYWFHDHPRIIPLHRVKPGQHGADALSHPVFASLLAQTHLYICLQSNVRALPWDFSRINIWTVISPSNRELLHWFVNAVLLYCARSPANGKVPFEEAKQPRANTLAPKARSQHSNKSGQISLVKLWWEWFLCGSPRVETQHMLSISVMWWMQLGQKCKPRETHGWVYRRGKTVCSQIRLPHCQHTSIYPNIFEKCLNCLMVSCKSSHP